MEADLARFAVKAYLNYRKVQLGANLCKAPKYRPSSSAHYPAWKRRRAPASMLAEHGVKRSRLEIPWGELSVDEKSQDLTEFDATLLAVLTAEPRPAVAIVPHFKNSLNLPFKAFQ